MNITTLLIIILVIVLLGGGFGWHTGRIGNSGIGVATALLIIF